MHETFEDLIGETFAHLNKVMKEKALQEEYLVERNDSHTVQFSFGAEAMVKVKQGMLNETLREVYLISQKRTKIKQREVIKTVRMSEYFRKTKHVSNSPRGSISLYAAHSSAVGRLLKIFT